MKKLLFPMFFFFVFLVVASTAQAQDTKIVESGHLTINLGCEFMRAIKTLGISLHTNKPAEHKGEKLKFPFVGGALDIANGRGNMITNGGLILKNATATLQLQNLIVSTTGSPLIESLVIVNGTLLDRYPFFHLILPVGLTPPYHLDNNSLLITCVGVTLTATGAVAFNDVFNVTAFKEGFYIGSANIHVEFCNK